MQHTFFMGMLVALSLFFVEPGDHSPGIPGREKATVLPLDSVKWNLVKIYEAGNMIEPVGKNIFIRFDLQNGKAGGKGGCNSFGSTLAVNGNTIRISNVFSTKMYCEGVQATENSFLSRLQTATRYEITGSTLRLFAGEVPVLEFTAN
jgi:heat shock protein HslJ